MAQSHLPRTNVCMDDFGDRTSAPIAMAALLEASSWRAWPGPATRAQWLAHEGAGHDAEAGGPGSSSLPATAPRNTAPAPDPRSRDDRRLRPLCGDRITCRYR